MRSFILFLLLMAMWLLMSGHYSVLITGLGLASVVFAVAMARRMGGADHEGLPLNMAVGLPFYLIWLMKEIVMANIATARVILSNTPAPQIFTTTASQKTEAGLAAYANSITLTPGTVTVDIDGRVFLVHALVPRFGDDLRGLEMARRVSRLESGATI